jgi:multidrug efflux system outer membrane protein
MMRTTMDTKDNTPPRGLGREAGRLAVLIGLAGGLAGCAVSVDRAERAVELPAVWRDGGSPGAGPIATAGDTAWWRAFGSPELEGLIAQAQAGSLDVASAVARVRQAEGLARIAGAGRLPELAGTLEAGRQGRTGGDAEVTGNRLGLGLAARYDVDLWGLAAARREDARQGLRATAFDRDAVQLGVTAAVAATWLQALGLRGRIEIAERHLDNARRILQLVESRGRAGAVSMLDQARQRGLVAAQERALAELRQQSRDTGTALSTLLGRPAVAIDPGGPGLDSLRAPSIDAGAPSQLLLRRPDIARAEAQLAAADADVAAARAAMLPAVSLGAAWLSEGRRLGTLFDNPVYGLAAGLAAPLFDGGRRAGERDVAEARREALLAAYRAAIVGAFGDVERALNAVAGIDAQVLAQDEEVAQARRAAALSESRYRAGAETLLALLDAQRTLYGAQDLAVQLRQALLQSRVGLYKALGGGWRDAGGEDGGPVPAGAVAPARSAGPA